jgi:hypothetical protein
LFEMTIRCLGLKGNLVGGFAANQAHSTLKIIKGLSF